MADPMTDKAEMIALADKHEARAIACAEVALAFPSSGTARADNRAAACEHFAIAAALRALAERGRDD